MAATFKFQMGERIIHKKSKIEAIVGKFGTGPNGLAYELWFDKSEMSGKFFPKNEVEKEFKLVP